jgi:MFS family permease
MQNIAIGWLALDSFHSGSILGGVTAARYLPLVTFGLWGGVVVDRVNTRSLLLVTQSLAAALALTLALVARDGYVELPLLLAIVTAIGCVDVFDVPSRQSIVSQLVDRERLGNAVGLTSIATNVSKAAGPAAAGAVIAISGVAVCFLINAASFVAFAAALTALRTSELLPARREPRSPGQVRAGLSYVRRTPALSATLLMVVVTGMLTWELPVTLPLLTTSTFDGGASAYGFAMAAFGGGAVLGGFVSARRREFTVRALAVSAVTWGIVLLATAVSPTLPVAYGLLVCVGITGIMFNVGARTLLQIESASHMRGRVMALWFMGGQGSTLVGAPLVGAIGGVVGARFGLVVGGAAALAIGLAYLRQTSAAARVDAVDPADRVAAELADD